jgi:Cd2+/Zn2+-exporting ATPase
LAFIPPLFVPGATLEVWLYRALVFLVISCPCALVVSVPLGFFAGIGASARIGVLVKGGNYLHALAKVTHVVFDKTGTLTKGVFSVQEVKVRAGSGFSEERLLAYAASVENHSNHPIARSIVRAVEGACPPCYSIEELSGFGLKGKVEGQNVIVGNRALLKAEQVDIDDLPPHTDEKTEVLVAVEGRFVGVVLIADTIREDALQALAGLRSQGIKRIVMLTGDNPQVAGSVARAIGIDEVHSQLLPQDKVRMVEHLLANKPAQEKLLFVGDGINDAPVIARADIGMAMGALGSDAAIEAADIVIMTDGLGRIGESIAISKRTLRIVKQNIVFALAVKILVLGLGALGMASMWAAVFADTGVAFLAILNSLRILGVGRNITTRL